MRKFVKNQIMNIKMLLLLVLCVGLGTPGSVHASSSSDFYENVSRLNQVLVEINRRYVEDVDAEKLTDAAIKGIRRELDPHTAVFKPSDYEDLRVHTDGEFGGLGIQIGIRENILTVISPIYGTPAWRIGLQAGDKIIKIEGKTTIGLKIDKAVEQLRGLVDTDVTITVARTGVGEPFDLTITRGKIKIESVPYYGMLDSNVGYIKVAAFSRTTGDDVKAAVDSLNAKGMTKLVLDLRLNPGGLLSEAIRLGELFLPKGSLIVSTKGRTQETEGRSTLDPIFNGEMVTLINEGSASASEIVSGALQDWDRSVVMGKNSFGKGSVQSVYQLGAKGHGLKLTTAFYYLPKGRCVNKPENGIGAVDRDEEEIKEDSMSVDSSKIFYTANGREMHEAGGVKPDVEVDLESLDWVEALLLRQNMFFRYAVKEHAEMVKKGIKSIDEEWQSDEDMLKRFREFVIADTSFTKTKSRSEGVLEAMTGVLLVEKALDKDTAKLKKDEAWRALENFRSVLKRQRLESLMAKNDFIKEGLKREMLLTYNGDKASTKFRLKSDFQVLEALKYLKDDKLYKSILTPKPKELKKTKKVSEKNTK
jgi:carboxyl-terminal processing protease